MSPGDPADFTVHRESGWPLAAVGLGLVMAVEALPVHLLLMRAHPWAAWVATALTLTSFAWLIDDVLAFDRRPMRLERDRLLVRVGRRWSADVPFAAIESVTPVRGDPPARRTPSYLRATAFGDPTLLIKLREPAAARGPAGITRRVSLIGVAPDEKARFEANLGAVIRSEN